MARKIFLNYRRDDAPGDARGVRDGLAAKFGKSNVFMDVDNLLVGQRFDMELAKALDDCDVLVVVIGPRWMDQLKARMANGERDYVREEIAAALARRVIVIPVRVGREGSMPSMPRPHELPDDIRDLVLHQKLDVAHERFGRDIAELVQGIASVRSSRDARARTGSIRTVPWAWLGAAAVGVLAMGYVGYRIGTPVPSHPPAAPVAVKKAPAEAAQPLDAEVLRRMDEKERPRVAAIAPPPSPKMVTWRGWHECNGVKVGTTAHISIDQSGEVHGSREFYPMPDDPGRVSGSFRVSGRYQRDTGNISILAGEWINQPSNYLKCDFVGKMDPSGARIVGTSPGCPCGNFELQRE